MWMYIHKGWSIYSVARCFVPFMRVGTFRCKVEPKTNNPHIRKHMVIKWVVMCQMKNNVFNCILQCIISAMWNRWDDTSALFDPEGEPLIANSSAPTLEAELNQGNHIAQKCKDPPLVIWSILDLRFKCWREIALPCRPHHVFLQKKKHIHVIALFSIFPY